MSLLSALRLKKQSREVATATLATPATDGGCEVPSVASVATVTVASPKNQKHKAANDPGDLEELAQELYEERAAIMEFDGGMERTQAEHMALLHTDYLLHHWTCKTCCAAGQGRGQRCAAGAALWAAYDLEATP